MITRAIVEEVITPYKVRVRIPFLDRAENSPMATSKEDLNIATICTLPCCYINVQVGDIVFVGFEDYTYRKVVILGHLSMSGCKTYADMNVNNLTAVGNVQLPVHTTIGSVNSKELSALSGVRDNLQKQIDSIIQRIDTLHGKG